MMVTLNDLLSTFYEHDQQRTIETNEQLNQLHQHVAAQRLSIQQAETRMLQVQEQCLDQMRPLFATDARALLKTPQFGAFVEFLLERQAGNTRRFAHALQVSPSPAFWLINSVPIALHLHEIESIQLDNLDGTANDVELNGLNLM